MAAGVAVVVVNWRTPDLALQAARSVIGERDALPDLRLIIVDGGSDDGSAERIAAGLSAPEFAGWASAMPLSINGGFGWANNQAILTLLQAADPPAFIYLLNPDATIEPGAIARLLPVMAAHPRAAAVGSLILEPDGSPSGSHFRFPTPRREIVRAARTGFVDRLLGTTGGGMPFADSLVEADWVTGACVLFRAEAFRDAGVFDSGFFLYFEEVELMWRMRRRGWIMLHDPSSRVVHLGGAATGVSRGQIARRPRYLYESQARFFMLTSGWGRALAANLGWQAGHAVWRLRTLFDPTARDGIPHEAGDRARHGLPHRALTERADLSWSQPPGAPPLWMVRGRRA